MGREPIAMTMVVMTTMVVSKLVMVMIAAMMMMVAVTVPVMAVVKKLQAWTHGSPFYVEGADARNPLRESLDGSFNG